MNNVGKSRIAEFTQKLLIPKEISFHAPIKKAIINHLTMSCKTFEQLKKMEVSKSQKEKHFRRILIFMA